MTARRHLTIMRNFSLKSLNANLPMVCTNPDIFVDFGNKRIFCAGALASRYMNLGGKVYSFGKPHEEIYNFARNILHKNEIDFGNSDLLCIGDGLHTDIKGANNQKNSLAFYRRWTRKSIIDEKK